jgi:hypothetical protein
MGWNAQINDANLTLKCDANGAAASLAFLSLSLTIAFANRLNSNIRNTGSPPSAYDTDCGTKGVFSLQHGFSSFQNYNLALVLSFTEPLELQIENIQQKSDSSKPLITRSYPKARSRLIAMKSSLESLAFNLRVTSTLAAG